eukprot:6464255-Amphidinium_carterae.2
MTFIKLNLVCARQALSFAQEIRIMQELGNHSGIVSLVDVRGNQHILCTLHTTEKLRLGTGSFGCSASAVGDGSVRPQFSLRCDVCLRWMTLFQIASDWSWSSVRWHSLIA